MRNVIIWNGISSDDLGLIVEKVPSYNRPRRKVDVYNVPGRNGDIVIPQDAWENIEQSYEIWGGKDKGDAVRLGYAVAEWLCAPSGYQKLEDTYDPEHYRKAYFPGPFDVDNWLQRQGRTIITFNCDPRRFLNDGEIPFALPLDAQVKLMNPTQFQAKPLISVTPNGTTQGSVMNTNGYASQYMGWEHTQATGPFVLDSEKEAATWPSGTSRWIGETTGKFIILGPGENVLQATGGTGATYTITPNWWEL